MQNAYQMHSPVAQRGGRAFGLAPQASMIDPNLNSHDFTMSHMSQALAHNHPQPALEMATDNDRDGQHDNVERTLPSTDVTDETLGDAYAQFILYCNPSIPDHVDTTELKKGFRVPPRSDNKNFDTFVLFGLISRIEAKDIKNWTDLVVELGVELPDRSKKQSTQKLQQYAVRLKVQAQFSHSSLFASFLVSPCLQANPR